MRKPIKDLDKFREQFVRQSLRRDSFRWPPRREAMLAARTERRVNPKTGKLCWHVRCALCQREMLEKEGRLDHVKPAGSLYESVVAADDDVYMSGLRNESRAAYYMGSFLQRLLCSVEGFQVLCTICHDQKSARERVARKGKGRSRPRRPGGEG